MCRKRRIIVAEMDNDVVAGISSSQKRSSSMATDPIGRQRVPSRQHVPIIRKNDRSHCMLSKVGE